MKLIKEGQPIRYKTVNGQEIPVIQPEENLLQRL